MHYGISAKNTFLAHRRSVSFTICFLRNLTFSEFGGQKRRRIASMSHGCQAMTDLRSFLRARKPPFSKPIHAIMGNEAADVDSLVCAISLAYAWQRDSIYPTVPVANLKRQDLVLRPDALMALDLVGLKSEDLICLDDLAGGLEQVLRSDGRITLVDHNELAPGQSMLEPHVFGIVDHHEDSGKHQGAHPRLVEKVGSCATLITELVEKSNAEMLNELAGLLICAILLDTGNLSASMGKATAKDEAALSMLSTRAGWDKKMCATVYEMLQRARSSVEGFSAYMLMKKDLKVFTVGTLQVAIASIESSPTGLEELGLKGEEGSLDACVSKLREELNVHCVLLLLRHNDPSGFRRDMAITKGAVGDKLQVAFAGKNGPHGDGRSVISTTRSEFERCRSMWWLRINDPKVSRKVVAPVVLEILRSCEGIITDAA